MKKIIILTLAIAMVISLFSVVAFSAESIRYGDANLDGKVNIKDATYIQRCVAMLSKLSDEAFIYADVDANNSINVKDATMIQKVLAGIIDRFPAAQKATEATSPTTEANTSVTAESSSQATEPTETPPTEDVSEPNTTTPEETTTMATDPEETTVPITSAPIKPTGPSVDNDGYFNEVIRP